MFEHIHCHCEYSVEDRGVMRKHIPKKNAFFPFIWKEHWLHSSYDNKQNPITMDCVQNFQFNSIPLNCNKFYLSSKYETNYIETIEEL